MIYTFRITDHGDYSPAVEERLELARIDRQAERREELERQTSHVLACIRGERRDLNRDGTTKALDMTREVTCLICEHAGLDELVRRMAKGDKQAVLDQLADIFDDCVKQIAEDRLPYYMRGE
jgi:class 3 adenylate cyclase